MNRRGLPILDSDILITTSVSNAFNGNELIRRTCDAARVQRTPDPYPA